MAHRQLYGSKGNAVELDTTALVHESYLRLIERGRLLPADRAAFFAYVGHVNSKPQQQACGETGITCGGTNATTVDIALPSAGMPRADLR